jgi:hypothetical protein
MLFMTGTEAAVEWLCSQLGAAAELTLTVNPAGRVEAVRAESGLRSARLREVLEEMIGAPARTARVRVTEGTGIHFGAFGPTQTLNVRTVRCIEQGAPGIGLAVAIHEIWENYQAWQASGGRGKYGPAHASAVELEGVVGFQLTGRPGARVAAVDIGEIGRPAYVLDLQDRFVVLDARTEEVDVHGLFVASVRDRVPAGTFDLGAFPPGERINGELVEPAAAAVRQRPRATARVTALYTDDEPADVSQARAEAVRNALVVALGGDEYAEQTGILLDKVDAKGAGADLGAQRAWTNPDRIRHETLGVRIDIATPANPG